MEGKVDSKIQGFCFWGFESGLVALVLTGTLLHS